MYCNTYKKAKALSHLVFFVIAEDGGVCDPVIDEHFRRSLGKDYMSVFAHNGKQKHTRLVAEQPSDLTSSSLSGQLQTIECLM